MVARLEGAPRAGPGERRRTNRWTGARIASFSTNFVRPHLLGVAAPGQLNRSAAHEVSESWVGITQETLDQNHLLAASVESSSRLAWAIPTHRRTGEFTFVLTVIKRP